MQRVAPRRSPRGSIPFARARIQLTRARALKSRSDIVPLPGRPGQCNTAEQRNPIEMKRERRTLAATWRRALRQRLVSPLLAGEHPPEYAARGVLVGLAVALTPTTGVQMPIVVALWIAAGRLWPQWTFPLWIALAWTWVSNVVTLPPLYYLYVVTGRVLLGRWDRLRGYEVFHDRLYADLSTDATWVESLWAFADKLLDNIGWPILVGSIPWTILGACIGYYWSLRLVRRYHQFRERRRARRKTSNRDS